MQPELARIEHAHEEKTQSARHEERPDTLCAPFSNHIFPKPYLFLSVSITVTDGSNGSYLSPTNTVAFKLVSSSEELKKTLEELNPDFLDDGMAFVVDDDGNPPGIYIQNSGSGTHSIAAKDDGNSTIDAVVKVPSDVYFCVYVSIAVASTLLSHSSVTVQISKKNLSTGRKRPSES